MEMFPNTTSSTGQDPEDGDILDTKQLVPSPLRFDRQWIQNGNDLTVYLRSKLPHPYVATTIMTRGKLLSSPFYLLQRSSKVTSASAADDHITQISGIVAPTAHPVHFARTFIQLAFCLQRLDSYSCSELDLYLNESTGATAHRFLDVARQVTSQDVLIESLDGLETLMLEASYQIGMGNLRDAWVTFRRALSIAQLMGLPDLCENRDRAEYLWFRLIYAERYVSLMLGLPFTITDDGFAEEQMLSREAPSSRLERIHVVIAGRIITRNIQMQRQHHLLEETEGSKDDCRKQTYDIDRELKKVAKILPVNWWVLPAVPSAVTDLEMMDTSRRLLVQLHHHYLLILLHQPYLTQTCSRQKLLDSGTEHHVYSVDNTYSKLAIVAAGREVLSRFILFRNIYCLSSSAYRGLEHKLFVALTTFLLAHLDGHRIGRANVLEHQRPHDLGIVSIAIEYMDQYHRSMDNKQPNAVIELLRKLVEIEADAAEGTAYRVWRDQRRNEDVLHDVGNKQSNLSWSIPYFGMIHILREEPTKHQPTTICPASSFISERAP